MTVDTVITNGKVIRSGKVTRDSIAINNKKIVAVGKYEQLPDAETEIDAAEKIVMPGVVDPHVHIDEVPENRAGTYSSETAAAALGGVTTIIDFAWQGGDRRLQGSRTLKDGIKNKISKGKNSYVDYSLHGVLSRENTDTLDEIAPAIDLGVTSFKMFMSSSPVGVDTGFLNLAFDRIAELDAVAAVHTEDPAICDRLAQTLKKEGKNTATYYPQSRPDYAEAIAADTAIRIAKNNGVKYYGVHTTSKQAADTIQTHQIDGSQIRAETCTHYTTLTEEVYSRLGSYPQISPPIRSQEDVESIHQHLHDGALSVVSTDHSAYHVESKEVDNWWDSPFGANSLQVSLSVFHDEAIHNRDYTYPQLVQLLSTNPANTFGLKNKGSIEPGNDADIVIFDPNTTYEIASSENASNADFSIYEGKEVTGKVEKTFVRGTLVADQGNLIAQPGTGSFIKREIPNWN